MKKNTFLLYLLFTSCICFNAFGQSTTLHENFTTCISSFPTGWQQYSVIGTDVWSCTTAGESGNGVQMSGYSSGNNNTNEDWLISPQLNLNSFINPFLSFWSRTKYAGAFMQVLISNNYIGAGNPNSATWTVLPATLPLSNSDFWLLSEQINLTAFKNQPLFLAFKYTSTTTAAATWKVDEINVSEGALTTPDKFINVGQCAAGNSSTGVATTFTMSSFTGTLQIDAPAPFELSKDNIAFSTQLNYTSTISSIPQTIYIRISPSVADKIYRNKISFMVNNNLLSNSILVLGTSIPDDQAIRIATWNMRWFGDPNMCNCDTSIARQQATIVLKNLHADLYCIQEMVNVNKVALLANALGPQYAYSVSPFGSLATSPSSGNYAGSQKLAYIFNTQKIQSLGNFGLLASTYPADTATNSAYYCFASGRFPYIMKAKIVLNGGITDTMIISNIHAKASSTTTDYNRRTCAAEKMTDSLLALFPNKKILVVGDFNDYIVGTDVSGQTISPYQYLLNHGFTGITLPSLFPNQTTYVGSSNHILDNMVCNSTLYNKYIDSSCFIFNEVLQFINNYASTTSDHIPVMSYFKYNLIPTNMNEVAQEKNEIIHIQNPSSNTLSLQNSQSANAPFSAQVFDLFGNLLYSIQDKFENNQYHRVLPNLHSGLYIVRVQLGKTTYPLKWLVY